MGAAGCGGVSQLARDVTEHVIKPNLHGLHALWTLYRALTARMGNPCDDAVGMRARCH